MNIILIHFAIKYKGDWDAIYKALEDKEKVTLKQLHYLEGLINKQLLKAITILDLDYPKQLKKAYKPPFVIFYEGDKKLLQEKFICATGNDVNEENKKWIDESIHKITSKNALVSSLYKGIDEYVYQENKGKICLVSASGLDQPFFTHPVKEHPNQIIISEYPKGTNVKKERLIARNRIIAAMSESMILFSSNKDGGIMNLVSHFLNQGKEIFCFPGTAKSNDGNTELIKQGANLITSIEEAE